MANGPEQFRESPLPVGYGSELRTIQIGRKEKDMTSDNHILYPEKYYQHVHVTPTVRYQGPDVPWGELYVKDETQQVARSFKFRGTFHRLLQEKPGTTVVTASTGNHALGVATAARELGLNVQVFVPQRISRVKAEAIVNLGATITPIDGGYDECVNEALRFSAETGAPYISSLDDPAVVGGHASLFQEVIEQLPEGFDTVFVPVGGGGLLAGCLTRFRDSGIKVVGVELAVVPSMKQALATGERVLFPPTISLAEGMLVRQAGVLPLELAQQYEALEIVLVSDQQIRQTMRLLWRENGIRAEGAGAAALAAALCYPTASAEQRAVAVVSGGNVDDATFQEVLDEESAESPAKR
jgi:threonine dehydratase